MADDDKNLEPNLELPKLFGRKKSGKADAASNKGNAKREAQPETELESEPSAPVAPAQPAARTTPATPTPAEVTPATEAEVPPRRPTAPVSATPQAQSVAQMPDPAATVPTTEPDPTPAVSAPATAETSTVTAAPVGGGTKDKVKRGLPTVALPSFPRRKPRGTSPDAASGPKSSLPRIPLPPLNGRMAAALTGAVIGLGLVLSTAGVLRGCDAIRGTKSCGGAGGFALLVVLIVLAVYVGALLLRAFGIPDPGSTSFLAVGIVVVLSMVVFIDSLLDWWMFLLIPAMSAGAYALSHYITTAVVEPAMDQTRDQRVD
ncbi:hypothetical protein GCM10027020_12020 [Nocardioides salsibiostraticola]